jgi:hypothetical protein
MFMGTSQRRQITGIKGVGISFDCSFTIDILASMLKTLHGVVRR